MSPAEDARHPADAPGPLAFVDDVEAPALEPADRHHLERVVRLRTGDPLNVSDGEGRWRACRFGPAVEPVGPVVSVEPASPPLTLCFALLKGDRPELVVQKLTELGVDRLVPFTASRSVVRWEAARAARHLDRLRAVARAAAAQSRRPWLPEVQEVQRFDDVAGLPGAALCERGGSPPGLTTPVLIVGPEGGWDERERAVELPRVALGEQVLRAETAAVAAGTLLTALRAGIIRSGERPGHAG